MSKKIDLTLFPSVLNGEIKAPPSKSLSHRALICAALAKGQSIITNISYSEDVIATINALELMGAKFEKHNQKLIVHGTRRIKAPHNPINCNESGSTLRFLIPVFSLSGKKVSFTGNSSLIKRPQSIYKKIFKEDKNTFELKDNKIIINGSVTAREYILKGNVSSQFFSGLMFSLPLLKEDSTISIDGTLESKGYIDLTIKTLEEFGIEIIELESGYFIKGNQSYEPTNFNIEGDYSQAAFFLVGGILNGRIKVSDLEHESFQGDKAIIDVIKSMKGKVIFMENGFITDYSSTKGTTIDLSDFPDLGPIIALLGCLSEGKTKIINASRLRIKESDRIDSTVRTLKALGANISSTKDEIIIKGKTTLKGGVTVDSYNDHRIAMMVSIAASLSKEKVILTNANAVSKSYPNFFEDYKNVGGKLKIIRGMIV
jgi:3-phosphoshikimate 1-carboxyvinyltransferase